MKIKAIRKFSSGRTGHVVPGRVLVVSDEFGNHLIGSGLAESLETKPAPLDYEVKPAQSSPQGRPRQGITSASFQQSPPSQSTTHSESSQQQNIFTPATLNGGDSTTPRSGKTLAGNSGRRTRKRRGSSTSTE